MSAYLICICSETGVPIFARKCGDLLPIPFSIAAALQGVSVFGKIQRCKLMSTLTETSRFLWRDFHDRLSFIVACTDDTITEFHLDNLITNVFNSLVLIIGFDEIMANKNVDKLKREFKKCYPLIDTFLQGMKVSEKCHHFGDLTRCVDIALQNQLPMNYQPILDQVMEHMNCIYGCFIGNGALLATTKDWANIPSVDQSLLVFYSRLVESTCDVGVYLPISSANVPFRLVIFSPFENIKLCVLCDPELSFSLMEKEVNKMKKSSGEDFKAFISPAYPFSNSAVYFDIHESILGFVLVNLDKKIVAWSVHPNSNGNNSEGVGSSTSFRIGLLRTFYKNLVDAVFQRSYMSTSPVFVSPSPSLFSENDGETAVHNVMESYWASEFQKCHGTQYGMYQLFVMFDPEVTLPVMRHISRKLLSELAKDKTMRY